MFDSLKTGLQSAIKKLLGSSVVDEAAIKEFVKDLQRSLIQADVNVRLVLKVSEAVQRRAIEEKPFPGMTRKDQIVRILYEELEKFLGGDGRIKISKDRTNVCIMLGIQGSGKTTTVAKLARVYSKRGFKVGVVAADTFRPGAVTQLKTLMQSTGAEVFSDEKETDSVRIARVGKQHFEKAKNLILIDTAGRHKDEKSLLNEMKKMVSEVKPDYAILIVDGTVGQQIYNQALAFHDSAQVGGIIITKLDGAAKGGGALAACAATGARVLFIGTGERIDDLEEFVPSRFVGRLLGMGDLRSLLDMAKELEGGVDEKVMQRVMSGKLTMNDFLYQFEQVNKMGSLKKIVELIPGFSGKLGTEDLEKTESSMRIWKSIIQSMSKEEREAPEKLNASRVKRIASGSGRREKEVRDLLSRYRQTKALMKASKGREFRQLMRRMGGQTSAA